MDFSFKDWQLELISGRYNMILNGAYMYFGWAEDDGDEDDGSTGLGVRSEKHAKYIRYNRNLLKRDLGYLGQSEQEHCPALQYEIMQRLDLLIDLHPSSKFSREPLKGMPLTYMGHISERRETMIDGENHLFLYCSSNAEGKYGRYYPENKDSLSVYTSGPITWVDNSHLQMIAPRDKNKFDTMSIELLRRIKEVGEETYNKLSNI